MIAPVHRVPWLTVGVFVATGVVTGAQFIWPPLVPALQREPAMLSRGEVWRIVTAWLVQSDGWHQAAVNFSALAIVGTLVERQAGRLPWVAAYVAGGLAGEVAGVFWQPVGGGNSVATYGLIGLLAAFQLTRTDVPMWRRLIWPELAVVATLYLCSVTDIHGPPLVVGALAGLGVWLLRERQGIVRARR